MEILIDRVVSEGLAGLREGRYSSLPILVCHHGEEEEQDQEQEQEADEQDQDQEEGLEALVVDCDWEEEMFEGQCEI